MGWTMSQQRMTRLTVSPLFQSVYQSRLFSSDKTVEYTSPPKVVKKRKKKAAPVKR
jgi:hypothetical protein